MQLNNEFAPVMKSSNKMETNQASIEMTAHMFQILSAGIYQHPERACIRELSCNALDGQSAAGNADQPFKVHLPTQLEPYFEVRDFGTGMTHEQVMKLYLTYGASTKRDSNDQIGGLGIGSKSPFAVAQSFTVTSYVDGVVRRYSVYMEEGVPQVTKLTESATTEPNGVAVRVAIPIDKINKFREEANRIYTHFPVKPDCNITLVGLYDGKSILSKSDGEFTIFSGNTHGHNIDTSIVMGNIEYPINLADVMPNFTDIIPQFLRRSIDKALIYMPIGSVNIAASRESLTLTDNTKKEIEKIFSKVAKEILSQLQAKIDTAKNLYEAIKFYFDATVGNTRANSAGLMHHLTWGGKTLAEWEKEQEECRSDVEIDTVTGQIRRDYHNKPKRKFIFKSMTYMRVWAVRQRSEKRINTYDVNSEDQFTLFGNHMTPATLEKQVLFVIEDRFQRDGVTKKSAGRAAVLKEIADKFVVATGESDGRMYLVDSEKEVKDLAKLHHYPEDLLRIYKASDYEYAYVAKKAVRGQVKLWQSKKGGNLHEVKVELDDYDDPQYYIKAEGNELAAPTLRDGMDLQNHLRVMSRIVPTQHVFMFRKTVWNKIPEEWIEIDLSVIEKAVKNNPEWWIDMNHRHGAKHAFNRHARLDKLKVKLYTSFQGRTASDGYVDFMKDGVTPDPRGINFEDNMDVMRDLFGRPQIVFADAFYPDGRYNEGLLSDMLPLLPDNSSLKIRIKAAQARVEKRFIAERNKGKQKYKLLSWIDWDKVSLREVAEHLGHTVTPYINKI